MDKYRRTIKKSNDRSSQKKAKLQKRYFKMTKITFKMSIPELKKAYAIIKNFCVIKIQNKFNETIYKNYSNSYKSPKWLVRR